jgi:GntR family transcriptional repressor for pyruvate dehydrogenase complex
MLANSVGSVKVLVRWLIGQTNFKRMNQNIFSPLTKQQSMAEVISSKILDLIRQKELQPGDRLPPERELAEMLGTSRPSLREALRALSIMKIIEVRQGDGTYITSLRPEDLVEHLDFIFVLDDSTLEKLFEARKVVEVGNVSLAAQRITDEELEALEECLQRSEQFVNDPDEFLQVDMELHEIITMATRNPMLTRFMLSVSTLVAASRQKTGRVTVVTQQSAADHRKIVAALKARDPQAASAAMLQHLEHVEQGYQQALDDETNDEEDL